MCTAITFKAANHYFGRNLDLERSYGERVVITPRNFPLDMRLTDSIKNHLAIIGMATEVNGYPLYFEAANEAGLSMAGLNFPYNAEYKTVDREKTNVTSFELIPFILSTCKNINDVQQSLEKINIADISFSEKLPHSPLHWIISDRDFSITVESVTNGVKIYENKIGLLTNNPTFDYHLTNLNNYMQLHESDVENSLGIPDAENYSLGMGAMGLPGDFSSPSRFVRAAFVKLKSVIPDSEEESVNQFFHILSSVAMPKGCVRAANGDFEYTRYSSCINTDKGIYYYTTYEDRSIKKVDMQSFDLEGDKLIII